IAEEMLAYRKVYFLEKYQELEVLGHGGFATVFSGIRIKDSFPVWLLTFAFHRSSVYSCLYFSNPENVFNAGGNQTYELIMVFEKPENCMDLDNYLKTTDKPLSETHVKVSDEHLELTAVFHRECPGVFHRDIKPHNILIETSSEEPECDTSILAVESRTRIYNSPEWFMYGFCSAEYTTAWQLGVVMYQLLHNKLPFDCDYKIINQNPPIYISFLKHYKDRFTLEDLRNHMCLLCVDFQCAVIALMHDCQTLESQ
uniref:Serine/threonine-protein kinase 1 n=1 Tax=Maylandia zebra TaxID=106582 RepID=A0A3P9BHI6_9CICH